MLCESCTFLPVYNRYSLVLPYGLPLFLVLRIEAAIKFKDFNSLISKNHVVQIHILLRGLCDSSPRLAHDLLCWNRYQRNMFCQISPTYYLKLGEWGPLTHQGK